MALSGGYSLYKVICAGLWDAAEYVGASVLLAAGAIIAFYAILCYKRVSRDIARMMLKNAEWTLLCRWYFIAILSGFLAFGLLWFWHGIGLLIRK